LQALILGRVLMTKEQKNNHEEATNYHVGTLLIILSVGGKAGTRRYSQDG
jgi:hypothetical protein